MEYLSNTLDLYEVVAGPIGPRSHVGLDARIGGKEFEDLPDLQLLEFLRGLYNRQWALEALAIEYARSDGVVHSFNPPRLN